MQVTGAKKFDKWGWVGIKTSHSTLEENVVLRGRKASSLVADGDAMNEHGVAVLVVEPSDLGWQDTSFILEGCQSAREMVVNRLTAGNVSGKYLVFDKEECFFFTGNQLEGASHMTWQVSENGCCMCDSTTLNEERKNTMFELKSSSTVGEVWTAARTMIKEDFDQSGLRTAYQLMLVPGDKEIIFCPVWCSTDLDWINEAGVGLTIARRADYEQLCL